MADFSRLPNEMISQIWGNIQEPEDVESFALVSKHVYAIGRPFVEEHNKLKEEFAFFKIGSEMYDDAPASLLKKVLLRPRIALYVTHLSFGRFRCEWDDLGDDDDGGGDDDQWPNNCHVPYPDNVMALFIEMIRKPSFVPRNETSYWIKSVRQGDEDPIFALLCMLLPNLSMLTLRDAGFYAEISQETILRIAEAEKTIFLKHLVTVNSVCPIWEGNIELAWWRTLAALPSVQNFHFDQIVEDEGDGVDDIADSFVSDSYNIRELTFINSGIHPKVLAQLLDSVKGLKRFSYVGPNERFRQFKPFWIRTALLANAKHSLEYLEIQPRKTEHEFLGTLRGFTALKEIKTDVRLLCRWSRYRRLADLLPSSIEKICLDIRHYEADNIERRLLHNEAGSIERRLVQEMVKEKSRLLPHLKALKLRKKSGSGTIGGSRRRMETLEEKCKNVGIELTFIES